MWEYVNHFFCKFDDFQMQMAVIVIRYEEARVRFWNIHEAKKVLQDFWKRIIIHPTEYITKILTSRWSLRIISSSLNCKRGKIDAGGSAFLIAFDTSTHGDIFIFFS